MNPPTPFSSDELDMTVELLRAAGGSATYSVRSGESSMLPTLRPGQRVRVRHLEGLDPGGDWPEGLRRGDLVLFRQVDYLTLHRLLGPARRVDGRFALRTRGDGHASLDPPVTLDRLLGRIVAIEDRRGWWDLNAPGARFYAAWVARHDRAWAAIGAVARALDRAVRRIGLPPLLERAVAVIDAGSLRLVHATAFRIFHRRGAPDDAGARRPER